MKIEEMRREFDTWVSSHCGALMSCPASKYCGSDSCFEAFERWQATAEDAGLRLQSACADCGAPFFPGSSFCAKCGAKREKAAQGSPECGCGCGCHILDPVVSNEETMEEMYLPGVKGKKCLDYHKLGEHACNSCFYNGRCEYLKGEGER